MQQNQGKVRLDEYILQEQISCKQSEVGLIRVPVCLCMRRAAGEEMDSP